jgi:hypothetical protein
MYGNGRLPTHIALPIRSYASQGMCRTQFSYPVLFHCLATVCVYVVHDVYLPDGAYIIILSDQCMHMCPTQFYTQCQYYSLHAWLFFVWCMMYTYLMVRMSLYSVIMVQCMHESLPRLMNLVSGICVVNCGFMFHTWKVM